MAFSYTGLAYLFSFLAVGLLSYRFFQYWQKEKSTTSKLFFYFAGFFALFMLTTAIPSLFFADNAQILRWVVILAAAIQVLPLSIAGYLIIYLKFPKISPWLGFSVVCLLGLGSVVLTVAIPFQPYLESGGAINWNIQPLANNIRSLIFCITFFPLFFIVVRQSKTSEDPSVKTRALALGTGMGFGVITVLFEFLLEPIFNLPSISSDIAIVFISVAVIITVLSSKRVSPPQKEEKYTPPPSQIQW